MSFKIKNRQNSTTSDTGSVLIETVVSVVLLLLFVAGVVDLGRVVHTYVLLNEAASEAVRLGARVPDFSLSDKASCSVNVSALPSVRWNSDPSTLAATGCSNWSASGEQTAVVARALMLLSSQPQLSVNDMKVISAHELDPAKSVSDPKSSLIAVSIEAGYHSLFPLLGSTRVHATQTMEYLF